MHSRNLASLLAACALALLAACAPIAFGEQELWLRHDAKQDSLELLLVYDSIRTVEPTQEAADASRGFAERVEKGRREFMVLDWPLHFDLEELLEKARNAKADEPAPWKAWSRELFDSLRRTRVVSSGYCRGKTGRLSLYQVLEFPDVSRTLSSFERAMYVWIERSQAEGTFELETHAFDARTRGLWIEMAKSKRPWLKLADGRLTVDLPATDVYATSLLRDVIARCAEREKGARTMGGLVSHLESVHVADERLVLTWKLSGPTFTFWEPEKFEYDPSLAESLRESGILLEDLPSRADVEARFAEKH